MMQNILLFMVYLWSIYGLFMMPFMYYYNIFNDAKYIIVYVVFIMPFMYCYNIFNDAKYIIVYGLFMMPFMYCYNIFNVPNLASILNSVL